MILRSLLYISLPIFSGILLVHLVWRDRKIKSLLLKVFLGTGIGLGVNSLLYFVYLLLFNHHTGYLIIQILILVILAILSFVREKDAFYSLKNVEFPNSEGDIRNIPNSFKVFSLIIAGSAIIFSLIIFFAVSASKIYGAWDAWAIYNRIARFIYRGDIYWRNAFSAELPWYFHADYPPLVALNTVAGWRAVGEETIRIPMAIGGAFLFGSMGLLFAGVNFYKTLGQASLAIISLVSVSGYIKMGSVQIADIPLSFFILATVVLLYIYAKEKQKELLVLAGLSAGLAAWTKNEGIAFALISVFVIPLAYQNSIKKIMPWCLLGMVLPVSLILFFKIILAPSGDIFVNSSAQLLKIIDLSRHKEIIITFVESISLKANWGLLLLYILVLGVKIPKDTHRAIKAGTFMLVLELISYYGVFLLTPHPLDWHLYALPRLLLQVAPLFFFLYFSVVKSPETMFEYSEE